MTKNDEIQIVVGQKGQSTIDNKALFVASGGNGMSCRDKKFNGIGGLTIQSENRNDIEKFGGIA